MLFVLLDHSFLSFLSSVFLLKHRTNVEINREKTYSAKSGENYLIFRSQKIVRNGAHLIVVVCGASSGEILAMLVINIKTFLKKIKSKSMNMHVMT